MRDVRYKQLPAIGGASGSWTHSSLVEFLFAIPYLFTRVGKEPIPPHHILNDLFMLGIADAGMSGGCEWKPFEITRAEYDELVEELCTMPTRTFVRDEELEKVSELEAVAEYGVGEVSLAKQSGELSRSAIRVATLVVACAISARGQPARATSNEVFDVRTIPADSGVVLVRGDRLDVVFPRAVVPPAGCGLDSGGTSVFRWRIGYHTPQYRELHAPETSDPRIIAEYINELNRRLSVRSRDAHIEMVIRLPRSAAPTLPLLDSMFARTAIAVWTSTWGPGDTPIIDGLVEPDLRAIYFDQGRVHFVIKGAAAVKAFTEFAPDSAKLQWCSPDMKTAELTTALVRRD